MTSKNYNLLTVRNWDKLVNFLEKNSYNIYVTTNSISMEKLDMSWNKETRDLWKAFENAVLNRDKKQFEIYTKYVEAKNKEKTKEEDNELILS